MSLLSKKERVEGAIVGLLIGDALGVPYEFHERESIPPLSKIEYDPPKGFRRAHQGVPIATWSDDGSQALCLLASLLHNNALDLDDLANRFVNWFSRGYMAVNNHVFDIGITTQYAIENINRGINPLDSGEKGEMSNGNGSLMRVLPLALWHQGNDSELIRDAQLQSRITHGHLRSQLCCALYCLWARNILNEVAQPWEKAVESIFSECKSDNDRLAELELHIKPLEAYDCTGTGYVVDCLHSAKKALEVNGFEKTVKTAIAFGNDTDTTACVAGGIAGLIYGVDGIPQHWRDTLKGKELYEPLLTELLLRYTS